MTPISNRNFISLEQALQLRQANLLVEESHRVRPRYFDGKFLAARDLTRDQAYFLARQSGFARALGSGIVEGLQVRAGTVASDLEVDAGFGYTTAGELVSLSRTVRVSLAQLFRLQTLAAQLDTLRRLNPPLRNRTGVFVLGLRALEFSANPVAAYPSTLDGPRQVEEGDIVEASALTLSHWVDAPQDSLDGQRGALARDAFVTQSLPALPAEMLPLAIVAIAGDNIRWIDMHLVRRAAGQAHADVLGFGFAPRLQREAHLAQYTQHLSEVMARGASGRPNAAQHFSALPAAGPMPAAALNAADFSQSWFPPGVDAELMLVPEDEIPALVEESLLLPPIDLSLNAAAQESTAVAILVPVPRESLARQAARLRQRLQRATTTPAIRLGAKRLPLDTIRLLANTRLSLEPADAVADGGPGGCRLGRTAVGAVDAVVHAAAQPVAAPGDRRHAGRGDRCGSRSCGSHRCAALARRTQCQPDFAAADQAAGQVQRLCGGRVEPLAGLAQDAHRRRCSPKPCSTGWRTCAASAAPTWPRWPSRSARPASAKACCGW